MSLEKKWVIIQAYKHNQELHRQWSHSYVVEDNDDYFVLASIRASVIEADGRKWHTKEPAMFILSKKHWFNVIAMFKEEGISYYVNIASPAIYDKRTLDSGSFQPIFCKTEEFQFPGLMLLG